MCIFPALLSRFLASLYGEYWFVGGEDDLRDVNEENQGL